MESFEPMRGSVLENVHTRLVNKCMSTHLNANANVLLDSNANANANAIFQERIQMQMFWLHICKRI